MLKIYTIFVTKMAEKPHPLKAGHNYMAQIRKYQVPPHPQSDSKFVYWNDI